MQYFKSFSYSILLVVLISLFFSSCFKNPTPMFSYDPADKPEEGEEIEFINESLDAKDFYWDFGNGQTSEEESASTRYHVIGNYTVTLVAENLFRSDSISENILIYPPTILEFYFYDYDGEPLQMARVEVYMNYNDAQASQNIKRSGSTNNYGMVKFNNLDAAQYYIWMEKGQMGGIYLSGGTVGPLKQNEINIYYAYAQFFPDGTKKNANLKEFQFMVPK